MGGYNMKHKHDNNVHHVTCEYDGIQRIVAHDNEHLTMYTYSGIRIEINVDTYGLGTHITRITHNDGNVLIDITQHC